MFYTVVWLVLFGSFVFGTMDVMDMPFMEMFDTDYPLNGVFYVLYYVLFVLSIDTVFTMKKEKEQENCG